VAWAHGSLPAARRPQTRAPSEQACAQGCGPWPRVNSGAPAHAQARRSGAGAPRPQDPRCSGLPGSGRACSCSAASDACTGASARSSTAPTSAGAQAAPPSSPSWRGSLIPSVTTATAAARSARALSNCSVSAAAAALLAPSSRRSASCVGSSAAGPRRKVAFEVLPKRGHPSHVRCRLKQAQEPPALALRRLQSKACRHCRS